MDEVVALRHHSVSAKGLRNCLDMKCNVDERPEQKTNLYTKRSGSHSKHALLKPRKLRSPTSGFPTDNCFDEDKSPRTGFEEGEIVEPELRRPAESKRKSLSPNKTKFIQDMVERFDWHGRYSDDKTVVCPKRNKMLQKGPFKNCDDSSLSEETESRTCHQRTHTKSENSSEMVSSCRRPHPSKSPKPSPAPKPRRIPKDTFLLKNILDGSNSMDSVTESKQNGYEIVNGDIASSSCTSCAGVSSVAANSAACGKLSISLSQSCGDLNQNIWSESSNDLAGESSNRFKSSESVADDSADEDICNRTNDSVNLDDAFDESDQEYGNVGNSASTDVHQARSPSPSVTARQSSSSSTKTLVARDSLNQRVTRVPSCDDLGMLKQLRVEYVNETVPAKPEDLVGMASFMHENNVRSHQNGSQTTWDSFQTSQSTDGPGGVNASLKIGTNGSNGRIATTQIDVYDDPPYEIIATQQTTCAVHFGFDEPLSEASSEADDASDDANDDATPQAIPGDADPIQGLDLQPLASCPVISPRWASPCGSPALKPRKTSRGHINGTLLSQVVLPPSPAPRTPYASYSTPPAVAPRVPARGPTSGSSQPMPSPSTLPRKFPSVPTLSHCRSSRRVPPPPPPIAEVLPEVLDPPGGLDVAIPFVPQRSHGRHNSCATGQTRADTPRSKRPSAGTLRGCETMCIEVDSGNRFKMPTRSAPTSTSSQSVNDPQRNAGSRGSTLSLHVPAPSGEESGEGQLSPSRSEGYLPQSSDGYMPMGSQRSTSASSELSSPSDSMNEMGEMFAGHSQPFLPPRVATLKGHSRALSYAASDTTYDDLNRIVRRDNSYLELRADEDYDKYSYLSLYAESEPLYQHYHQGAVVRQVLEQNIDDDDDDADADCDSYYNPQDYIQHAKSRVDDILKRDSGKDHVNCEKVVSGLSTLETAAKLGTGFRKLWCEMPKVKESGLLDHMTPEERRLQESLFEILSSEASYLKSLNLLVGHFMAMLSVNIDAKDRSVLSKQDFNWLFSNARAVRSACIKMLEALEEIWQQGCVVNALSLCCAITGVVREHYGVYVTYCSNANYQERKLKELNERSPEFCYSVRRLEDCADCHSLPLSSFLALPMQRITRMPLLITAMCRYLRPDDASSFEVTRCIHVLQKIVKQCNEGARKMSNLEHMNKIDKILVFRSLKKIPLISQSRHLVKKGFLVHIVPEPSGFLKKSKRNLFFFLFNDLLVITKKKSEKQFEVLEYSPRSHIHAQVMSEETVSNCLPYGVPSGCKNLFIMALVDKHVEFILSCESQSEQLRWIQAVTPVEQDTGEEVVYTDWDCPQVQAVVQYLATEPDELSLEESDIVNVLRKINDGWYEGERIRDGERGWFPASHTVEIQNAHVRARNLRQQYQLMKNSSYVLSIAV